MNKQKFYGPRNCIKKNIRFRYLPMAKSDISTIVVCALIAVLIFGFIAQFLVNQPSLMVFFYKSKQPLVYKTSYVQHDGGSASGYT